MKKILLTMLLCLFANISFADVMGTRENLSENLNNTVKDLKESFSDTQDELEGTERSTTETKTIAKELFERSKEKEQNPTVLTHGRKDVVNCTEDHQLLIWRDNVWQCGSALVLKGCDPAADEYAYEDDNGNMVCSKTEKGKNINYYWKFRGHSSKCVNVNEGRLKLYDCYYKNKQNVEIQVENSKCSAKNKPNAAKALCYGNWNAGNWGGCSKSCGGGTQIRPITCPAGYDCSQNIKPTESQSCNTHTCVRYVWRGGCREVCGGGAGGGQAGGGGGYVCETINNYTCYKCSSSCSSVNAGYCGGWGNRPRC